MFTAFRPFGFALLVAAFLVPAAHAATYLVPPDAQLVQTADDIVVATGVSARSERDARGSIVTRYTLLVEETIKGDTARGQQLVLTELGGVVDGKARVVSGAPAYEPGARYLVFTSANRNLEPITSGMSLGQFRLIEALAVRDTIHGFDQNMETHVERARDAQRFLKYVRDVVAQRYASPDYFVADAERRQIAAEAKIGTNALTRSSYLLHCAAGTEGCPTPLPFRWLTPSANWVRSGTQPGTGDGPTAVVVGFGQWNNTASSIDYADAGVDNTALGGLDDADNKNAILFNDPNNEIPAGVAGIGGAFGDLEGEIDGENSIHISEGDLVIAKIALSQACLNAVMTHEVGHTLGFRHSNEAPPGMVCGTTADCTSDAIMNFEVSCLTSNLRLWDHVAAETVYGDGPVCREPAITQQPGSPFIREGSSTPLQVFATGSGLTYQWYVGNSGDPSQPIPGGNASVVTVSPVQTTKYWVRISGTCGPGVDSVTVTVTVTPCVELTVGEPSATPLPAPGSYQLSVTAFSSSTPLTFLWFRGNTPGVGGTLVGSTQQINVTVNAVTSYWVRVNNGCGRFAFTSLVTVAPPVTSLPMLSSRFTVEVRYRNQFANPPTTGLLLGRSLSSSSLSDTAIFWFGDPTVVELMVRLSDARPFDDHIHVFYGGLSDVEFFIKVTDSLTGQSQEYNKKPNELVGFIDRTSFSATGTSGSVLQDGIDALMAQTRAQARALPVAPNADTDTVTMLNGRYQVRLRYRNQFANPPTTGYLLGRSIASSNMTETVVFFNDPQSVEWMVRFSDARPFDDHIHFFHGGLSDLELTIEVTDTQTGQTKEYIKLPNKLDGTVDRVTWTP